MDDDFAPTHPNLDESYTVNTDSGLELAVILSGDIWAESVELFSLGVVVGVSRVNGSAARARRESSYQKPQAYVPTASFLSIARYGVGQIKRLWIDVCRRWKVRINGWPVLC